MLRRPAIALALGGGAARGLAHLGVIRILEEERIPIDRIVGTSIGSLMGGMYAANPDAEALIGRVSRFLNSPEFRATRIHQLKKPGADAEQSLIGGVYEKITRGLLYGASVTRRSILAEEEVMYFLDQLVEDLDMADTKIPFAAVATGLKSGRPFVFTEGPVRRNIAASTAIPGVFPPVLLDGEEMVDGGLVSMVPVEQARDLGADLVLAVNISAALAPRDAFVRGYEILVRTADITKAALLHHQLRDADIVVEPDVGSVHWADFSSWQTCIDLGERAMMEALPAVREALGRGRLRIRRGRGPSRRRLHAGN